MLCRAAFEGYVGVLDYLINAGADVNLSSSYDVTALNRASHNGHDKCVALLLGANANPNKPNNNGFTPLMLASGHNKQSSGYVKCVNLLLDAGADVNRTSKNGQTALMLAASSRPT